MSEDVWPHDPNIRMLLGVAPPGTPGWHRLFCPRCYLRRSTHPGPQSSACGFCGHRDSELEGKG